MEKEPPKEATIDLIIIIKSGALIRGLTVHPK